MDKQPFLYEEMKWPEIREVAKENRVVIIPVGTIEDHGYHLPIISDVLITTTICRKAAERIPEEVILMPPQYHGYSPHHMDFPGPITIEGPTFIAYMRDITKSLVHHGFKRILLVNGHGSNGPWLETVARLTIVDHPSVLCALLNWWAIPEVVKAVKAQRTSERGGTSHAGELETSLMLAIRPDLVDMSKAVKDISYPTSQYFPLSDFYYPSGSVRLMPYWSTITTTGTMGDPTVATKEKGMKWLEAAVEGLIGIIRDYRKREIRARIDHH
ncbi:MAG: creatininase family protein [Candidatus Heimdallarchaeota archaeon]